MISVARPVLFAVILGAYLVAGLLYAVLTPAWQAPDEPAHYNYVRYVATQYHFPELVTGCYDQAYLDDLKTRRFPPELSVDNICYEFHQPPLYYLLASPIFLLANGSLIVLRLFSIILGAGVVVFAFLIGRTIFPARPAIAFGTMAFVAFVPMHVAILASVNNDALAEFILAVLLWLLVRRLIAAGPYPLKGDLLLAALLGLGLITKTTIYIAVVLVAVALWLAEAAVAQRRQNSWIKLNWAGLFKRMAFIYGVALMIAMPWFVRNATLYGNLDIIGLKRHDDIVIGQLRTTDFVAEVGASAYVSRLITTTFRSFWGQFGWMAVPMDGRTYRLLTLLTLIALTGLVGFWIKRLSSEEMQNVLVSGQQSALSLMALTIFLMILAYIGYNLAFVQFQGRYLFPSLIPLGFYFSLGLYEALSRRRLWWLVGGLILALIWIIVSSKLAGGFDKWAILIVAMAAVGQVWLVRYRPEQDSRWLLAACYLSLGLLTLAGPFWFIVPHL